MGDSTGSDATTQSTREFNVTDCPVVVAWQSSDPAPNQHSTDSNLKLDYNLCSNKALFTLHTSMGLKRVQGPKNVYLFIHPERIRALTIVSNSECDVSESFVRKKLGDRDSIFCLQFELDRPPVFVAPIDSLSQFRTRWQPVLDSYKALAKQSSFLVYLPIKTLPRDWLLYLCEAASTHGRLTSLDDNIGRLYGGKGGKIVGGTRTETAGAMTVHDSPPSYDELGHSPPPNQRPEHKRRRGSWDSDTGRVGNEDIGRILQAMKQGFGDLIGRVEQGLGELGARVERLEHSVREMGTRMESLGTIHNSQAVAIECETRVAEAIQELRNEIGVEFDDERCDARIHAEDYIRETIDDTMPDKIREHLRGTYFSIQEFGD